MRLLPKKKINDFQGLYNTYQTLGLNKEISIHLLDGLIFDQKSVQIRDEKELIEYCYRVAGTMNLLMCPILGCKNKEAFKFAVDLGVGMQMTNIARDVFEDSNLNRRCLPGTWINSMTPEKYETVVSTLIAIIIETLKLLLMGFSI